MEKLSFAQRLRQGMDLRGYAASELAERAGLSRSLISKYIHGVTEARQNQLYKLAVALDVSEAWLMGYDVPIERVAQAQFIATQSVPLLGEIACGKPIFAQQNFEAYCAVGAAIQCDFCLRARGDSMIGARIQDGDIVFIRKQPRVENGEIAAVLIDDEATLKRVYLNGDTLVLQAENPAFPPLVFKGEEIAAVSIMGKAVAFHSDLR